MKKKSVGGPVPLHVATESVLFGDVLEQKLGRVMLAVAGVAFCYWLTTRKR